MDETRIRVLLLAEQCSPDTVSVALTGWGHARALHDLVDLHLVTHEWCRSGIAKRDLPPNRVTFIENRIGAQVSGTLSRLVVPEAKVHHQQVGWATRNAFKIPEYYLFERAAWRAFASRLRGGEFDLVHRLTPMSPVMPSYIAHKLRRIGVPFVVGPLNGGLAYPKEAKDRLWQERDFLWKVRGAYKALPLIRSTRRDAAAILVAGRHTLGDVPQDARERCFYIPEIGIFPERMSARREGPVARPLQVATTGRLVPLKGFDLLLRGAAPLVRAGKVAVQILGDGAERERLERIIQEEGIEQGVKLHGWVEHEQLAQVLSRCDVFAFPSLKELGGGAVVEAMATGLVPIVVNYGGPGEVVQDDFGYRVPMGDEGSIVRGIREALEKLAEHPEIVEERREKARAWAWEHFTWERKAQKTLSIYRWVLGRGPRPALEFPAP